MGGRGAKVVFSKGNSTNKEKEWMVFLATQEIEGKRREVERGRNKRGKELES